jgi:hypothetical protein
MLSSDRTFAFNLLRWHGLAPYRGTDVAEMHDVAGRIVPGDFESWHREFAALAQHVEQEAGDRPVPLRSRCATARSVPPRTTGPRTSSCTGRRAIPGSCGPGPRPPISSTGPSR